jgi:hypothetical protein
LGPSARGSRAFGEAGYLCFSAHSAGLLASRTGATRPPEEFFAELEDVCSQSRPVHGRLRFPGRSDRPVPNSLCVPPDGGWNKVLRALQRHRTSNGDLDLAAASRSDSKRSIPIISFSMTVTRSSRQRWTSSSRLLDCGCCTHPREHQRRTPIVKD